MTAPDPRVGEIHARLSNAAPGPWRWDGPAQSRQSLYASTDRTILRCSALLHPRSNDAEFIANAPADIAYLLAELAARDEKLARVEALANSLSVETADPDASDYDRGFDDAHRGVRDNLRAAVAAAGGGGE